MNKKMIRNTLLLLLIPLLISLVISVIGLRKNSFSSTISYDKSGYVERYNEIDAGENIINNYNRSYTIMTFSAIALIIIFAMFYIILTRKKGW